MISRAFLISALFIFMTCGMSVSARACLYLEPVSEALEKRDVIFTGIYLGSKKNEKDKTGTFRLEKLWKGRIQEQYTVNVTYRNFREGKRYIVYGDYVDEDRASPYELIIPPCTATKQVLPTWEANLKNFFSPIHARITGSYPVIVNYKVRDFEELGEPKHEF